MAGHRTVNPAGDKLTRGSIPRSRIMPKAVDLDLTPRIPLLSTGHPAAVAGRHVFWTLYVLRGERNA